MSYKVPGLSSIILVFIALGIDIYQLITVSITLGIVYTICLVISFLNLIYFYCRKCPHAASKTCRHVIIGWITIKLFKPIKPSKYELKELIFALIPVVVIIMFAQYWLIQNISLFIVFWVLMLVSVAIIRSGVCTVCKNINCKFCPKANNCNS